MNAYSMMVRRFRRASKVDRGDIPEGVFGHDHEICGDPNCMGAIEPDLLIDGASHLGYQVEYYYLRSNIAKRLDTTWVVIHLPAVTLTDEDGRVEGYDDMVVISNIRRSLTRKIPKVSTFLAQLSQLKGELFPWKRHPQIGADMRLCMRMHPIACRYAMSNDGVGILLHMVVASQGYNHSNNYRKLGETEQDWLDRYLPAELSPDPCELCVYLNDSSWSVNGRCKFCNTDVCRQHFHEGYGGLCTRCHLHTVCVVCRRALVSKDFVGIDPDLHYGYRYAHKDCMVDCHECGEPHCGISAQKVTTPRLGWSASARNMCPRCLTQNLMDFLADNHKEYFERHQEFLPDGLIDDPEARCMWKEWDDPPVDDFMARRGIMARRRILGESEDTDRMSFEVAETSAARAGDVEITWETVSTNTVEVTISYSGDTQ